MVNPVQTLAPLAILLVVAAITLSIGADILDTMRAGYITNTAGCNTTNQTICGYDYNASLGAVQGVDELGSWQPTIGLVVAAAVVIGIVMLAF